MPSWDEPGIKATLRLTVDVPADRMAVANMPVASTETLPDGMKRVHFATTPKMSTYLYFLAIGDFDRISTKSDGTEVGVVVNRGDAEKARVALAEASRLLHYYNDYFGVPFPLPKPDLIVVPGAITGGSMENWGAIFYSQDELLFDPARSTEADRQLVFEVVSHEMAHQWFGDLVTMAWWDDLWLNEGFARWMQTKAADAMHPEWEMGLQALAIAERGKQADAKPSTHPILRCGRVHHRAAGQHSWAGALASGAAAAERGYRGRRGPLDRSGSSAAQRAGSVVLDAQTWD